MPLVVDYHYAAPSGEARRPEMDVREGGFRAALTCMWPHFAPYVRFGSLGDIGKGHCDDGFVPISSHAGQPLVFGCQTFRASLAGT